MEKIKNEYEQIIKDFYEDNDITYDEAIEIDLEDQNPLIAYDIGYLQGLKSAISHIEND